MYLAKNVCSVFFELNGQPRTIDIQDSAFSKIIAKKIKSEADNINQVGSPLPGQIAKIYIKQGDKVIKGDNLLVIEAMKMETGIHSGYDGTIKKIFATLGSQIEAKDLLVEMDINLQKKI